MAIQPDELFTPQIGHRTGAAGAPITVLRGPGTRVRTLWAARTAWGWSPQEIAREYGLRLDQVDEALAFAEAHKAEFEADLRVEEELARTVIPSPQGDPSHPPSRIPRSRSE